MKFTIAALCFMAVASIAQGLSNIDILKAIRECKKDNNCSENLMEIVKKNELPKTNEGLKSMYCVGQNIGLIMADNKINTEVMKTVLEKLQMDQSKISQVTAACQSCVGADHADAAKSLITCIKNNSS